MVAAGCSVEATAWVAPCTPDARREILLSGFHLSVATSFSVFFLVPIQISLYQDVLPLLPFVSPCLSPPDWEKRLDESLVPNSERSEAAQPCNETLYCSALAIALPISNPFQS